MKTDLVSIIIPTKNNEASLDILLRSIFSQTYKNIEVIIVDNYSTDKTEEVTQGYDIKYYKKGPERSTQRNYGASKSRGKYLFFLDSDMELDSGVVESCISVATQSNSKAIVAPEKTVGTGLLVEVRKFEREMYLADKTIELARFYDRRVFFEFEGYDQNLTGPEDYDLSYRVGKKYKIGRATEFIKHHEEGAKLSTLLKKKYYYASMGAKYATKHPELVMIQGNILFRKAYFRSWKKFVTNPLIGSLFIVVRGLEALAAVLGFVKAVGIGGFIKTLFMALLRK